MTSVHTVVENEVKGGRPEVAWEFAFEVQARLGPLSILKMPALGGERAAIYVTDGHFQGPGIRGKVVPGSGGDWAFARPDGVLDFDARYMLQEDDGTLIYMQSRGYRWASPEVSQRMMRGEAVDPSEYYMRITPRFEVAAGPHDWLTRHVFVGIGSRNAQGNVVRYYKLL